MKTKFMLSIIITMLVIGACKKEKTIIADFSYVIDNNMSDSTIQFTSTSSSNVTSWIWDFGDTQSGLFNSSTDQNPKHTFSKIGPSYTVQLTVSNGTDQNTIHKTVTVPAKK